MRYFLTVKYFLEGNRKAFFHYKRKTKRRTTRSQLNERTGYAGSFINFLLDCFPATHCNFIAQTPTCPTNQLAPGSPTMTYLPNLKLKFDYMSVIYLTVLLVIYITNLCRRKIFTCYSIQRRNSGLKRRQLLCMRRRQDCNFKGL